MQTTKLLVAFLCANSPAFAADGSPAPADSPRKAFEYHFATLRGASLQPAAGLQTSMGVQPSAAERGAAPAVARPTSEEEWRRMFPRKAQEK